MSLAYKLHVDTKDHENSPLGLTPVIHVESTDNQKIVHIYVTPHTLHGFVSEYTRHRGISWSQDHIQREFVSAAEFSDSTFAGILGRWLGVNAELILELLIHTRKSMEERGLSEVREQAQRCLKEIFPELQQDGTFADKAFVLRAARLTDAGHALYVLAEMNLKADAEIALLAVGRYGFAYTGFLDYEPSEALLSDVTFMRQAVRKDVSILADAKLASINDAFKLEAFVFGNWQSVWGERCVDGVYYNFSKKFYSDLTAADPQNIFHDVVTMQTSLKFCDIHQQVLFNIHKKAGHVLSSESGNKFAEFIQAVYSSYNSSILSGLFKFRHYVNTIQWLLTETKREINLPNIRPECEQFSAVAKILAELSEAAKDRYPGVRGQFSSRLIYSIVLLAKYARERISAMDQIIFSGSIADQPGLESHRAKWQAGLETLLSIQLYTKEYSAAPEAAYGAGDEPRPLAGGGL